MAHHAVKNSRRSVRAGDRRPIRLSLREKARAVAAEPWYTDRQISGQGRNSVAVTHAVVVHLGLAEAGALSLAASVNATASGSSGRDTGRQCHGRPEGKLTGVQWRMTLKQLRFAFEDPRQHRPPADVRVQAARGNLTVQRPGCGTTAGMGPAER